MQLWPLLSNSPRSAAATAWIASSFAASGPTLHLVNVGVVEHNQRALAAQLQRQALQTALPAQLQHTRHTTTAIRDRSNRLDAAADQRRAGEGDLVQVGCLTMKSPQVGPKPDRMLTTPAGKPASLISLPICRRLTCVRSAGHMP